MIICYGLPGKLTDGQVESGKESEYGWEVVKP